MSVRPLAGRVAIVTGAAGGIGRGLVDRFLHEGMRVVMADLQIESLEAVCDEAGPSRSIAVQVDVRSPASVDALRDRTLQAFGAAHVLCNNAGIGGGGAISAGDLDLDRWHDVFEVDFFGIVHGVQSFLPVMRAQGDGHIVNTASRQGLVATPRLGAYASAKFAAVALTEMLHAELVEEGCGVHASVLCPGGVRTAMLRDPDEEPDPDPYIRALKRERYASSIAVERVADHVVQALADRPLYILTHAETIEWIEQRSRRIAADHDVLAASLGGGKR